MRRAGLLTLLFLACCAMPPRVDDPTTPHSAYETFRGAVARAEHEREYQRLSDDLRRRMGVPSQAEWRDARVVALTQGHRYIKGIVRSKIVGEPRMLDDGRARLEIAVSVLFLKFTGEVILRPRAVLRVFAEGSTEPDIYWDLDVLQLAAAAGVLGILVPDELLQASEGLVGRTITRFEARREWFIDDFAMGGETPATVRADTERKPE